MGNTATCPSDMCGANKEFDNFSMPSRPGLNPAQAQHEARKVQTFHRYAEDGDVKGITMLCHLAKNSALSVDAQDDNGLTALHKAAKNGHILACKTLIKHGANPNLRSTAGSLPVDLAHRNHRKEVTAFLKKVMSQLKQSGGGQPMGRAPEGGGYAVDGQHAYLSRSPRKAFTAGGGNDDMEGTLPPGVIIAHHGQPSMRPAASPVSTSNIPQWSVVEGNQLLAGATLHSARQENGHSAGQLQPARVIQDRAAQRHSDVGPMAQDSGTQVSFPQDTGTQVEIPPGHDHVPASPGREGPLVVRDMDTQTSQPHFPSGAILHPANGTQPGLGTFTDGPPRAAAVADSSVQAGSSAAPRARMLAPHPPPRSGNNIPYPPVPVRAPSADDFDAPSNSTKILQTYQPVSQGIAKFSSMERAAKEERTASNPTRRTSSESASSPYGYDRDPKAMGGPSPIAEQSLPGTGDSTPPRFQCV